MASMSNVTAEELTKVISGKHELYEAAIRNGFYLPKFKSGILNETYITDVVCGRVYCPQFKDIRLLPYPALDLQIKRRSSSMLRTPRPLTASPWVSPTRIIPLTRRG